jgi:hypothetical protein
VLYSDLPAGTPEELAPPEERDSRNVLFSYSCGAGCGRLLFRLVGAGAPRSGEVSPYVRANRDRRFSRRANPAAYWIVVCWYLVLAMVCASGVVLRSWQQ